MRLLFITLLFLLVPSSLFAKGGIREGDYYGFALFDGGTLRMPVTMSAVPVKNQESGQCDLLVVMRLSYGGFQSHEYQAISFYMRNYRPEETKFEFDGSNGSNSYALVDAKIEDKSQIFRGRLRSFKAGLNEASLELIFHDPIKVITF